MSAETTEMSGSAMFEKAAAAEGMSIEAAPSTPAPATPAAAQEPAAPTPSAPATGEPAAVTPPAPEAPWKRKFNLQVYGQAKEVEADEARVTKALQLLEAEQDVRFSEQLAGAKWAVAQAREAGHDVELAKDPATGNWGMKWKTPQTTAPTQPQEPAKETPPETTDDELLKQAAEAYGEDSPAYKLFERNVKALAAERKVREQRDEEARKTSVAARQIAEDERTSAQANQFFQARAKAFEGERGTRASAVTRLALYALENLAPEQYRDVVKVFGLASTGNEQTRREEVFRIAGMFADDREQEWGERLKAALPAQPKPAPAPPPAVGTGSAAPVRQQTEIPDGPNDPNFETKFRSAYFAPRG